MDDGSPGGAGIDDGERAARIGELCRTVRFDAAHALCDDAFVARRGDTGLLLRAWVLAQEKKRERAQELLDRAEPRSEVDLGLAALVLVRLREPERALRFAERVVELVPAAWLARLAVAEAHVRMKRWPEAVAAARTAVELAPDEPAPHRVLAEALERGPDDAGESQREYQRAGELAVAKVRTANDALYGEGGPQADDRSWMIAAAWCFWVALCAALLALPGFVGHPVSPWLLAPSVPVVASVLVSRARRWVLRWYGRRFLRRVFAPDPLVLAHLAVSGALFGSVLLSSVTGAGQGQWDVVFYGALAWSVLGPACTGIGAGIRESVREGRERASSRAEAESDAGSEAESETEAEADATEKADAAREPEDARPEGF